MQDANTVDAKGIHLVSYERGVCHLCDLYQEAKGYVVQIQTQHGMGAGIVITSDGIVATSAHVVKGARKVRVKTFGGRELSGMVVAVDSTTGLALVRVESGQAGWRFATIEAGSPPPVGSEVFAIGHPMGLGWTITRGIISGYRQVGELRLIQTDAAISPGNSGGPLVDREGHLIGIVRSKLRGRGVENIAFAQPASALLKLLSREGVTRMAECR